MFKTTGFVRFALPHVHRWDPKHVGFDPPPGKEYLVHPHRHMFHFECHFPLDGVRAIEIIKVKEDLQGYMQDALQTSLALEWSCEEMAQHLTHFALRSLQLTLNKVIVAEDNENGIIYELKCS